MKQKKMSIKFSSRSNPGVIREWLHEYKSLPEAELNTYANTIRANEELIVSLYELFEDDEIPQEIVDPVCHQLFNFYRSGREELQRFTLELVPLLILTYLTGVTTSDRKKGSGIEACLLGIYNLEITDNDGNGKVSQFTIPSIACPSIYHEPPSLAALALTESALLCYHSDEHVTINVGPLPQFESVNAQNRLPVMTHVLSLYNRDVANLSTRSHETLCRMCLRLTKMGFEPEESDELSDSELHLSETSSSASSYDSHRCGVQFLVERRVTLSSPFLIELLTSIYFVMFNGHAHISTEAVAAIDERAGYELWADVLLVTNAIKNSLVYNPSGQPMDGPMGISIALSPTTNNPSFSKHAITNASFRAKKLPEDIAVPDLDIDPDVDVDTSPAKGARVDGDVLVKADDTRVRRGKGSEKRAEKKGRKSGRDEQNRMRPTGGALVDDIEVPDLPENDSTAPPGYDEILEQDRSKAESSDRVRPSSMFAKPLKSIMKSSKDKMKMGRKDAADARRKDQPQPQVTDAHSPRQGPSSVPSVQPMVTSQSLNLSQNSHIYDAEIEDVTVAIVRSSSRTKVDQLELRNVASPLTSSTQPQSLSLEPELEGHRRTLSFPEGGFVHSSSPSVPHDYTGSSPPNGGDASKPLLSGSTGSNASPPANVNGLQDSEDDERAKFTTSL